MAQYFNQTDFSDERTEAFRSVADRISAIASRYSVGITAYRSAELPLYRALPVAKQIEALAALKTYLSSMEMAEANGVDLDAESQTLWYALSALGFVPNSEMFSHFTSDDVIEVHSMDGMQLWRNFAFMKISSYTLEEMYSIEWKDRYTRAQAATDECVSVLLRLLTGDAPDIFYVQVAEHMIEETLSADRCVVKAEHRWIGRLKDRSGQLAAWISCSRGEVVERKVAAPKSVRPMLSIVENPAPQP